MNQAIPKKWKEVYRQCKEFLENPGTPATTPIEWCVQLIEELGETEAKLKDT